MIRQCISAYAADKQTQPDRPMTLKEIINNIYPLPDHSANKLTAIVTEQDAAKGCHILEAGKTERNVFFVKKGTVRAFLTKNGRDITFWIGTEGNIVLSMESYVNNRPGYETIECVEDSVLYSIGHNALQQLFREDIHIANWGRKLAEASLLYTEQRFLPLLFTDAMQRYENLLKKQPYLLQRIPLEHLASYLGITPVSLSRIRANLKKNS